MKNWRKLEPGEIAAHGDFLVSWGYDMNCSEVELEQWVKTHGQGLPDVTPVYGNVGAMVAFVGCSYWRLEACAPTTSEPTSQERRIDPNL